MSTTEGNSPMTGEAASVRNDATPAGMTRAEATRTIADARRLYRTAELVQARRTLGNIDSVFLCYRAVSLLLRVLVRLEGACPPVAFTELVDRAREIVARERLASEEAISDLLIIHEMRERLAGSDELRVTPAEDRRYDRAFMRARDWFHVVQQCLDARLPPPESRFRRWVFAPALLLSFAAGFALGAAMSSEPRPGEAARRRTVAAGDRAPTFFTTFYRDTNLTDPAFSRRDERIAFDWGGSAPAEAFKADGFGVRFDGKLYVARAGKVTFHLTSDDGSRLYVDGTLTIDNWGNHATLTREATVELAQGVHPVRVEYFDDVGNAVIRLEWSSARMPRRVISSADLR